MDKEAGRNRTKLTNEYLDESMSILQTIINVCNDCRVNGTPFTRACRDRGLDPKNTRELLLKYLGRCTDPGVPLDQMELDMYDGFEQFYKSVFGDKNLENIKLPSDYVETVLDVVNNTGLKSKEIYILVNHFGLGDTLERMTLEQIGNTLGCTGQMVRRIEIQALWKCRIKERREKLQKGLARYNLAQEQARELERLEMEQERAVHEELLKKSQTEYEQILERIKAASGYDEAVMESLPKHLAKLLQDVSIDELGLNAYMRNNLAEAGIYNLYQFIMEDVESLMKTKGIGAKTIYRAMGMCAAYTQQWFEASPQYIRRALKERGNRDADNITAK